MDYTLAPTSLDVITCYFSRWVLVQDVIARLRQMGAGSVRELDGIEENVMFPLPKNLQSDA